jgi:hypothetical protein
LVRPREVKASPSTGRAEGATGSAPSWKSGCDTRPTCQSWATILLRARCTASVTARQPLTCSVE